MFRNRRHKNTQPETEELSRLSLLAGFVGVAAGGLIGMLLAIPAVVATAGALVAGMPGALVGAVAGLVVNFCPLSRLSDVSQKSREHASMFDCVKPAFIKNHYNLSHTMEDVGALTGGLVLLFAAVATSEAIKKIKSEVNHIVNGDFPFPPPQ